MYESLKAAIRMAGIPLAEYGWNNAPQVGNYAVIALDSEAASISGDNRKTDYATQGTIDLFCRSTDATDRLAMQDIFNSLGIAWEWNSTQFEREKKIVHYEFVFELEVV